MDLLEAKSGSRKPQTRPSIKQQNLYFCLSDRKIPGTTRLLCDEMRCSSVTEKISVCYPARTQFHPLWSRRESNPHIESPRELMLDPSSATRIVLVHTFYTKLNSTIEFCFALVNSCSNFQKCNTNNVHMPFF